jgi:hypothetical protein
MKTVPIFERVLCYAGPTQHFVSVAGSYVMRVGSSSQELRPIHSLHHSARGLPSKYITLPGCITCSRSVSSSQILLNDEATPSFSASLTHKRGLRHRQGTPCPPSLHHSSRLAAWKRQNVKRGTNAINSSYHLSYPNLLHDML